MSTILAELPVIMRYAAAVYPREYFQGRDGSTALVPENAQAYYNAKLQYLNVFTELPILAYWEGFRVAVAEELTKIAQGE
jgi:hypothetical protein